MVNPDNRWSSQMKIPLEKTDKIEPIRTRPADSSKSTRKFEEIYDKEEEIVEDEEKLADEGRPIQERKPPKAKPEDVNEPVVPEDRLPKEKLPSGQQRENIQRESPSALYQKLNSSKERPVKKLASSVATESKAHAEIGGIPQKTGIQTAEVSSDKQLQSETAASRITAAQELIEVMVEQIEMMTMAGKTETVVTIQHPPIFAGSTVTISQTQMDPKALNISFNNLDPSAKNLLDIQSSQDSLRLALEQKGYLMNIMTTSTEPQKPILSQEASPSDQHGQQEGREGGKEGGGSGEGREQRRQR